MPPTRMFLSEQRSQKPAMTLLGQPGTSRFSQLGSPASSMGTYRSGAAAQAMANQKRIHAQQSAQRAARRAPAIAATRAGSRGIGTRTFASGFGSSPTGVGSRPAGYSGGTVVTPRRQEEFDIAKPEGPSTDVVQGLQGLVEGYNRSFDEANKANEERYQQLLGLSDQDIGQKGTAKTYEKMYALAGRRGSAEMGRTDNTFRQMLNLVNEMSGQRAKDITTDFTGRQASAMQNLANLGLANTSGASVISGGFGRKQSEALDRQADLEREAKSGVLRDRASELNRLSELDQTRRLGIMERGQGAMSNLQQRAQQTKMGVTERRTDAVPSSQSIMDIIAGVGSQYGGGTGLQSMLKALGSMRGLGG